MSDIDTYRENGGVNFSSLKHMEFSPAHFYEAWRGAGEKEQTGAMRFGTLAHKAILEPDGFMDGFIECDLDGRTKAYKEAKESALLSGKELIKSAEFLKIKIIVQKISSNSCAATLLKNGISENPIYWKDEETGIDCKALPDFISSIGDKRILVDLKTTACARPSDFTRTCYKYRYYQQAAWYMRGFQCVNGREADGFAFIAVESNAPHGIMCFYASTAMLVAGEAQNTRYLKEIKECIDKNSWPCYPETFEELDLPSYAGEIL